MSGVNKAILLGRLGKDPELTYTPAGTAVCKFSIATSDKYKGKDGTQKEKTEWHNIVVWKSLAESCSKYLAKGKEVYLEGSIQTDSWFNKDHPEIKHYKTEIRAFTVQFLSKQDNEPKEPTQEKVDPIFTTDDLPFYDSILTRGTQ